MCLETRIAEAATNPEKGMRDLYLALLEASLLIPTMEDASGHMTGAFCADGNEKLCVELGRTANGEPLNILFTSVSTLHKWTHRQRPYAVLPSGILFRFLKGTKLRTVINPSGPISYELTSAEIDALSEGRLPSG